MLKIAIKRPVTIIMIALVIILAGFLSFNNLNLSALPDMDIPYAVVTVAYPGAGPKEIEELVTKPLEEQIAAVNNIKTMDSTSQAGYAVIQIEFNEGTDLDIAAIDVREKINDVKDSLPKDCYEPSILKIDVNADPIHVGVTSAELNLNELNTVLEEEIVDRLKKIEGISSINLTGGIKDEVQITVIPDKLEGYGITISQISQLLKSENINLPLGDVTQGEEEIQLRSLGEFKSIEEIKNLKISTSRGSKVRLSDIANVELVKKDIDSYANVNDTQAIILSIDKQSTANIVTTCDEIQKEMVRIQKDYPALNLILLSSQADFIKLSVDNVISTAVQCAIVAVIILIFFLKDIKTSLIIGVSIPVSIFATFVLMYLRDMTLNMISLAGITIGIGMLVDNSVVVLENIYKYSKEGLKPKLAAYKGAKEVATAVMASTLTTVAVFMPLTFTTGVVGQIFPDLSYTICFALVSSLVVSLTFVPMACSILLKSESKKTQKQTLLTKVLDKWEKVLVSLDSFYKKILVWSLKNKKKTLAIILLGFILSMTSLAGMGFILMPSTDEGTISIEIELPKSTVLAETQKVLNTVLQKIDNISEKETVYATIGGNSRSSETNYANITVNLVDKKNRDESTKQIADRLEQEIGLIAGCKITVDASENVMGEMGNSEVVSLTVKGKELDGLTKVNNDIMDIINSIEGTSETECDTEDSQSEVNIIINREKASEYDITNEVISGMVSQAVTGSVPTTYKIDNKEIDIRIKYNKDKSKYVSDIKNIKIQTQKGAIPLTEVCEIVTAQSQTAITRQNQQRCSEITTHVVERNTSDVKNEIEEKLNNYQFEKGYSYSFTGSSETTDESFTSMFIVLVVAIVLVYMVMAAQFESLIHPLIVMFSMPIALTGGILGLKLTNNPISLTASLGLIMLVGMVVNNAIVLVDYANQLRKYENLSCNDALIKAGPSRLRPILMTTFTTIIGLIPLALGSQEGMELQQPLAISVIFGLSLSTAVTLILIPVLYATVDKLTRKKDSYDEELIELEKLN